MSRGCAGVVQVLRRPTGSRALRGTKTFEKVVQIHKRDNIFLNSDPLEAAAIHPVLGKPKNRKSLQHQSGDIIFQNADLSEAAATCNPLLGKPEFRNKIKKRIQFSKF